MTLADAASAPPRGRRIIAILLTIIPLSQIGLDVYTPALPQMAVEFNASNAVVQNTVTVYILGMAIAFIPLGLISDALGRNPVVLAGLGVLTIASVACAMANSLGLLLVLRFVQGIGAAAWCFWPARSPPTASVAPSWSRSWACAARRGVMIGGAQLAFGVVGPFLYQAKLGFCPATYGLIALVVGGANLPGELTCGAVAQRTTARRLALSAWAVFFTGGVTLVVSAELVGVNAWAITVGSVVALMGCGVLDPESKALAMGVFSRNIGLITGLLNTCCYLVVSVAMALMAYLPENSQAPLGWLYVGVGVVIVALILTTMPRSSHEAVH